LSKYVNSQLSFTEVLKSELSLNVRPRDKLHCINPNHRDSDKSLIFYGEEQGSFCFGCNKAYYPLDIITFARGINYYEALKIAESDYGAELPSSGDETKEVTKADKLKYDKLKGVKVTNKKQLHNLCLALNAVAEEDDASFRKYCEMKGIKND
jgi:hypothetical protein